MSHNFFEDETFQDHLTALLIKDRKSLKEVAHLLSGSDFKPIRGVKVSNARARWIVAERALEFYNSHQTPIRSLIRSDVLEYAESIGLGDRQKRELDDYCDLILKKKVTAPDAITSKVHRYKGEKIKAAAIEELVELHAAGQLTEEKWYEISQKVATHKQEFEATDYFEGYVQRSELRRKQSSHPTHTAPAFLIYPLDSMVRGISYGELGVMIGPPKRGKSLSLIWLGLAFALQRLNGLFITLEDPKSEVENRLDAAISEIPYHSLSSKPKLFRRRFRQFRRLIRSKLKIVDGTQGMSVAQIENLVQKERDRGFRSDFVIIDYDDEIIPPRKQKERRFEFADIYRDLRRLAARNNAIVWTAAQTKRDTEKLKILTGDKLAEDFSKARKATMVISLGQGDWGDDSIYVWVAYHKFDKQHIGCNIVMNKEQMAFYDHRRTIKAAAEHAEDEESEEIGEEV